DPGPVFHTIVSIKNDGHYFCRAGGNRPDGLNEPVTHHLCGFEIILCLNRRVPLAATFAHSLAPETTKSPEGDFN
ncbi:hypothetical protein OFP65_25910, partial [Escherichia coli]|nr:hypothetical protein [Escherichia coli]